jgi:hypothetical protein
MHPQYEFIVFNFQETCEKYHQDFIQHLGGKSQNYDFSNLRPNLDPESTIPIIDQKTRNIIIYGLDVEKAKEALIKLDIDSRSTKTFSKGDLTEEKIKEICTSNVSCTISDDQFTVNGYFDHVEEIEKIMNSLNPKIIEKSVIQENQLRKNDENNVKLEKPHQNKKSPKKTPVSVKKETPKPVKNETSSPLMKETTSKNEEKMSSGQSDELIISLSDMIAKNYPQDIDLANKEKYLSDEDFQKTFNMSKIDFASLPLWKRMNLKKAANIW